MKFITYGIKLPLITTENGSRFKDILLDSILEQQELENGDILVISGKVVAIASGDIIDLRTIKVSERAMNISEKSKLDPHFVQAVINHSDRIFGWASGALLTFKDDMLLANAGLDRSNSIEAHYVIPLPSNPKNIALDIKRYIEIKTGKEIGVIISDSSTRPMRKGTTGLAVAVAGLPGVIDDVGKEDLYGYTMKITSRAIGDNLVCSAQIVMGESNEQVPVCLIRGTPYVGIKEEVSMIIPAEQCIFMRNFHLKDY